MFKKLLKKIKNLVTKKEIDKINYKNQYKKENNKSKKQIIKSKIISNPKSYSQIMEEISKDELYERLLRYGLFSNKLPNCFTVDSFWEFCKNSKYNFENKAYDYIKFESIRNNFIPRVLGIPVPMAHEKLCRCISNNWEKIKEILKENTKEEKFKVSRIHIRKMRGKKEIFEMNYDNYKVDGTPEIEAIIGKKILVKTDISTCFPSMYTHAISWALIGKEKAKLLKKDKKQWFNLLDNCTSNETYGETHGFIIGPHTSNILSEIILTRVDKELTQKGYIYTRYIDDYSCYVENEAEANKFLSDLGDCLRKYDLLLNQKKTKIIKLPISLEKEWIRKLNLFQNINKRWDFNNVRSYLDLAVDLTEKYKDVAILKYSIKVINSKKLSISARNYFVKTIFHYSLIYQYLIPCLDNEIFEKYDISKDEIDNIINKIYSCGIESNNYEAVMYALYYSLKNNSIINGIEIDKLLTDKNCIVPLLGYFYYKKDKAKRKKIKNYAMKLYKSDYMDRNWIFIYEVLSISELKGEWKELKKKKDFVYKSRFY